MTGISRCALCGGPIIVGKRKRGQVNERVYICGWRKNRGLAVCCNTTAELVEDVNERVIQAVKALFTPQVVSEVLVQLRTILAERTRTAPVKAAELDAEAARLKREIERLTLAIATTDDRANPSHDLGDALDLVAGLIARYETEHFEMPTATPTEILKHLLAENGLDQQELAKRLEISVSHMSNVLNGTRQITVELARKLAKIFSRPATLFLNL